MAMEEVIIIGPSIKDTCWKCQHAMHWALRNNTNCAKYGKKPYEVYFIDGPIIITSSIAISILLVFDF